MKLDASGHEGAAREDQQWARWKRFRWNYLLELKEKIKLLPENYLPALDLRLKRLYSLK